VLAVLLAAPSLSRPIVNALGAVVTRPFGPIGRLARSNAVRNPRRTAATAFALTLGLMLVSLIATFGASAKASIDTLVDKGVKADYMLTGPQGFGVVVAAEDAARKVDGVELAVGLRFVPAQVGGENAGNGVSFSGPVDPVLTVDMVSGKKEIADDGMLVSETESDKKGWKLGDTVELTNYADEKQAVHVKVRVTGIFEDSQVLGDWIVSDKTYQAMTPADRRADFLVLIKAKSGADMTDLRAGLEKATGPYVVVQVLDREQFKGEQGKQIDTLLAVLYGLLALAIVIAILGIVNTLALSVVERRREIGMLRAVGMARNQVRRTIYLESVLIAVFGAIVGVILGLGLGVGFIRTLRDQGLGEIAIPWGQVIAMLIGSAIVGVFAALWPAARAARTKPLEAIADL
jgi:putative ABC transport system permease protein